MKYKIDMNEKRLVVVSVKLRHSVYEALNHAHHSVHMNRTEWIEEAIIEKLKRCKR